MPAFDPTFEAPDSIIDFSAPPRSYPNDPTAIARGIFRDELTDVVKVLRTCGALHTAAERQWCVEVLVRLLDETSSEDVM